MGFSGFPVFSLTPALADIVVGEGKLGLLLFENEGLRLPGWRLGQNVTESKTVVEDAHDDLEWSAGLLEELCAQLLVTIRHDAAFAELVFPGCVGPLSLDFNQPRIGPEGQAVSKLQPEP